MERRKTGRFRALLGTVAIFALFISVGMLTTVAQSSDKEARDGIVSGAIEGELEGDNIIRYNDGQLRQLVNSKMFLVQAHKDADGNCRHSFRVNLPNQATEPQTIRMVAMNPETCLTQVEWGSDPNAPR